MVVLVFLYCHGWSSPRSPNPSYFFKAAAILALTAAILDLGIGFFSLYESQPGGLATQYLRLWQNRANPVSLERFASDGVLHVIAWRGRSQWMSASVSLVHDVAANWNSSRRLKTTEPGHPYTSFGAKTAATFAQMNTEHLHGTRRPSAIGAKHSR
jgi:hypothetical protein